MLAKEPIQSVAYKKFLNTVRGLLSESVLELVVKKPESAESELSYTLSLTQKRLKIDKREALSKRVFECDFDLAQFKLNGTEKGFDLLPVLQRELAIVIADIENKEAEHHFVLKKEGI